LRSLCEAKGDQIEQHGVLAAPAQTEADSLAIRGERERVSQLGLYIGDNALLPDALCAIRRDQAESGIGSAHRDAAAAGKKMHNGVLRQRRFRALAPAFILPNQQASPISGIISSAREKPRTIGRPGHAAKIATADAARIGGVKPLQRVCVVNLDRRCVVETDGDLVAFGMNGDAEGFFSALCCRLRFETAIRVIAANLPIIGHGIEPIRAIEGCAIAAFAAIVFVPG
jgi:hypothetical protein